MHTSNKQILVVFNQPSNRFNGGIYEYVKRTFTPKMEFCTPVLYNLNAAKVNHSSGVLSIESVLSNLISLLRFYRFAKRKNFDIIHWHTSRSWPLLRDVLFLNLLSLMLRMPHRKFLLHIHFDTKNIFDSNIAQKCIEFILRRSLFEVIVLSSSFKTPLSIGTRCHVLNNYSVMKLLDKKKERIMLFVGSIDQRKNVLKAIEWFINSKLANNWKFQICGTGDGEYFARFLNEVSKYKQLEFLGYVDQDRLNIIYSRASIFILPSISEGMPIAAIDALRNGCVTLLSKNVGCHDEILQNSSKLLIDILDDEKCIYLLNELSEFSELSAYDNSIKSVADMFTVETHLLQLEEIYQNS